MTSKIPPVKPKNEPLIKQLAEFLDSNSYDTTYLTHGIHPYPAKYIPQLPRLIIENHTNERNTVLDPFCGSGTTLLEACIRGRYCVGIDSNPIATLISRVKTQTLDEKDFGILHKFQETIIMDIDPTNDLSPPQIPRINHWFQPNMVNELAWIKYKIDQIESINTRNLLLCVFSSIIVNVSNQESDTRYAAKDKSLEDGYAIRRFSQKLNNVITQVQELSSIDAACRNTPIIYTLDSRLVDDSIIPDHSIDLIVTSPPYPNSYDYYLYHKLRMYWLGYDPNEVKEIEIGSRNEHSSKKAPIEVFENKMIPIMENLARVLKPSKLAYFFIGDSIINGELINMSDSFQRICSKINLGFVAETDYSLVKISRSFHEKRLSINKNRFNKKQRILIFEGKTPTEKSITPVIRTIASPKSQRVAKELVGDIPNGSTIAIASNDRNRHIHALGKYPSKFLPDIPRWSIDKFSNVNDIVLDPFAGSGTTAVEGLLQNRSTFSVDISPYACLLAKAKTTIINIDELISYATNIERVLSSPDLLPSANRLIFDRDDFWFNINHLNMFERIRQYILLKLPTNLQPFFLSVLSTTIKKFSYLDESQIKVKRDPKKVLSGTPSPNEIMLNRMPVYIEALLEFNRLVSISATHEVICTSANKLLESEILEGSIGLIVTSPPYINAMNYPMAHRYENILLELVSADEYIDHQKLYYGTERVYSTDYSTLRQFDKNYSFSNYINPKLNQIFDREPKRSYIVFDYFRQMSLAFNELHKILRPGGVIVIVAGSNIIRNVPINTFEVLVGYLESIGFSRNLSFHYEIIKQSFKLRRHRTASIILYDGIAVLEKSN